MRTRLIGAVVLGAVGFLAGSGTGIVGGPFVAMAGVGVFTVIGIGAGLLAGPDIASAWTRIRRRR